MYSTCIFCHAPLGTNDAIEHFPVGRRLAFDVAKGRLWVICRGCERWNLTPLEERWEAIEECERAFAGTKLRVSTDEIGLARLREGTTLIRIGAPQRPELAAWRYGDQFGRRRKRYILGTAAVLAGTAGLIIAGPVTGLVSAGAINVLNIGNLARYVRTVARVRVGRRTLRLTLPALNLVALRPNDHWGFELEVPYSYPISHRLRLLAMGTPQPGISGPGFGSVLLVGDEALQAARVLLPRINVSGGSPTVVNEAVALLERQSSLRELFTEMARVEDRRHRIWRTQGLVRQRGEPMDRLGGLSPAQRLALEMALHEEDERRALEGELAGLEERWREAEEIAAISDSMFVSPAVEARAEELRKGDGAL
jgi:hypothetical protein